MPISKEENKDTLALDSLINQYESLGSIIFGILPHFKSGNTKY
ncbi:MAG: hypothetical protein R2836_01620 [Chitinophagales bacterium]